MKIRNLIFYVSTIGGFSLIMYWIIQAGQLQEAQKIITQIAPEAQPSSFQLFKESFYDNITHPFAILILQIVTIILTARLFGYFFKKIGQPTVIGEITAGIFLGPSFIGSFFPEFSQFLFPAISLGNLQLLSMVGLVFFMFIIGIELDLGVLKNKANDAVVISHASIIIPFALGVLLSYFLYSEFAPDNVHFLSFSLFMGIAMSITAFPVLARIIQERGLTKTRLGTIAITCAAADDVTAWCLLAAVIAIAKAGEFTSALFTIFMATCYVFLMLKIVRPFLHRMGEIYSHEETIGPGIVAVALLTLLLSSYLTEIIGIHALFGAFFAGIVMPPNLDFRKILINKLEDVAMIILLPLFFVFTGLRTEIGLLNEIHLWQTCGIIILIAVIGKFGGSAFSAKFVGQSWRESLAIGALMNTRGLMELVVLNIGYDLGILSPQVFSMFVLMALVTTFMTAPAMTLIDKLLPEKVAEIAEPVHAGINVLISFANPANGRKLLRIASYLSKSQNGMATITTLHLHPNPDINPYSAAEFERESFEPIMQEAKNLGLSVKTLYKISHDVNKEILNTVNHGNFDLLLVGAGHSIFKGTFLGNLLGFTARALNPEKLIETITRKEKWHKGEEILSENILEFIEQSSCPVGIFIDKNFTKADTVFIPLLSPSDLFLTLYIKQLVKNDKMTLNILDLSGTSHKDGLMKQELSNVMSLAPNRIFLLGERTIDKSLLSIQELMIVSFNSWKKLVESQSAWIASAPSTLIIKP